MPAGGESLLGPFLSLPCLRPAQATWDHLCTRTELSGDEAGPFSCCCLARGCHCSHRETSHAPKPNLTPWAPRSEKTVCPLQSLPWGEGRNGAPRVPQTTPHLCLRSSSLLCRAAPRPRPAVTGGLAAPALCHLLSLVCVLLGQLPGQLATQPPKQFPESRRLQEVLPGLSLWH